MKISLLDVDTYFRKKGRKIFPNLALMKISNYHKKRGDDVTWFAPISSKPDILYVSKIFTYTPEYPYLPKCKIIKGGTGYDLKIKLPKEIEKQKPDYSLYDINYGIGFLTRGCNRKCKHCLVPEKEGKIKINRDIFNIASDFTSVVLLDNNFLALRKYAIKQLKIIAENDIKIDFNQGLDARFIDNEIAYYLSQCKWYKPLKMACDSMNMLIPVLKATRLLRKHNCTPKNYLIYLLVKNVEDAHYRAIKLKRWNLKPFAQPYRDFIHNIKPTRKQKDFTRWVDHKAIFNTVTWEEYQKKIGYRL